MDKKVIHTVFEDAVRKFPSRIAVEWEDDRITYAGLNGHANRLSHLLRSAGCGKGTIVNVVMPSSIEWVTSMLAVFKSGSIFLPMDLAFSRKRLEQIFRETYDGIILTTEYIKDDLVVLLRELGVNVRYLIVVGPDGQLSLYDGQLDGITSIQEGPAWDADPALDISGDDSCYIFYTSGSTGDGKAILGAHAGVGHFIHWEMGEFAVDASFRVSQLTAPTFDASLRDVFISLATGGTLCIPAGEIRSDPSRLLAWLAASQITLMHCVPSLFRVLVRELQTGDARDYDPGALRYILMAGELLYAKDILGWRKHMGDRTELVNLYGPTETVMVKTFYRIGHVPENPAYIIPAGKPISNTTVAIIRNGSLCNAGEIGEVYIKTPFMSKGYYGKEALTAESFVQNPLQPDEKDIVYKTGDLGRYLPDGNIEVLGRLDSQVKVNGIRIELVEIEQAMLELEDITGAAVKTYKADDNLLTLIAYYTGKEKDPSDLRDALSRSLIRQMIPGFFVHLDEFPLTLNGKVDKKNLPLPQEILIGDMHFEAPVGKVEESLAACWKEILGLPRVGRNISFFSLGGHSLRAIQLVSRIHKEMGISLKIADIFTHRTIQELAAFLSESLTNEYASIAPAPVQEHYPLSSSQRRLWVLSQFEGSNVAYNMPGIYILDGELDVPALDFAFSSMIARHEILRTVFREDPSGEIRQHILSPEQSVFHIDFRDLSREKDREEKIRAIVRKEIAKPFDLSEGPLLRVILCQSGNMDWVFIYVMHHIISDAWSMEIFFDELLSYYDAFGRGKDRIEVLKPLPVQYKDYAVWQRRQLDEDVFQVHKDYWLQHLEGELPVLDLPTDVPRPATRTFRGDAIRRRIGAELAGKIRSLGREQDATLFMTLFTAVNILLYRYTDQQDIVVGSPVAGRDHLDLEGQIGFYINTLALRTCLEDMDSFKTLLEKVRQVTLKGYEHQAYPFDELVDALPRQGDITRNALFDVVVVLQNAKVRGQGRAASTEKLTIREYGITGNQSSKFDLTFVFEESEDQLTLRLEYNSDIYYKDTIVRLADHLEGILAAVVAAPDKPVSHLDYLTENEKELLLSGFNDRETDYPRNQTIITLFEEQAAAVPDNIAVVAEGAGITYRELNERANQLAGYLQQQYDLQVGDFAGIRLERDIWMIAGILGVLKSGAAYVPIDPDYPRERIDYLVSDSGCKMVLDADELARFMQKADMYPKSNPRPVAKPRDLAYVIYTSGTTGKPKGALIEHRNVVQLLKMDRPLFDFGPADVWTLFHSICFDFSVWEMYGALLSGGRLVLIAARTARDPQAFLEILGRERVTVLNQTPSSFYNLIPQEMERTTSALHLRYVIFGGEALNPGVLAPWKFKYPATRLVNMYGITETTVHVTYKEITSSDISDGRSNIGSPIPTLTCYILDSFQQLVPIGVAGELYVGGAGVCRGYLRREELTQQRFIDNPFRGGGRLYRSGDKVKLLDTGEMEYLGRLDHQVKVRGYRIELGEVENVLQSFEGVDDARVIVRTDGEGEHELIAYIVSRYELNAFMLRSNLALQLPAYMIPAHFVQMGKLPLTSNGKLDRKKLPDPGAAGLATGMTYVAPRNEIEKHLLEIWQEILDTSNIGVHDNFFDAGGNSIKLIKMIRLVNQRFSRQLSVVHAFRLTNISTLSAYLQADDLPSGQMDKQLETPVEIMEETLKLYNNDGE